MTAATEKQIAFAKRLIAERPSYAASVSVTAEQVDTMTKSTISVFIDQALKAPIEVVTADSGPSPKQQSFIDKLVTEREVPEGLDVKPKTKAEASKVIDVLMKAPKLAKPAAKATPLITEKGIYFLAGDPVKVYKVQPSMTTGKPYAKLLVPNSVPGEKGWWTYAGRDPLYLPLEKLTYAKAVEFGHLYGMCMCCGATLTDEKSIAAGIGPVCGKGLLKKETIALMETVAPSPTPEPEQQFEFDFDDLFDGDIKFVEVPQ